MKLGNNLWYGLLYGLKSIGNAMQDAWAFIWNGIIAAFEKTVLEIQKVWIKTKGFFDSDEEVEAEIARVEQAYNDRKSARENAKAQASAQRKAELASINDDWDRANASADEAQTQEILEHQKAYQDALTGAAEEIASARAAWQEAMDEVKQKAAEKADRVEEIRERTETAAEETEHSEVKIQEISSAGEKSMGAWSSEALDALLGGGAQERTAKATEQMAKNTQQTNKLLKKIGQDKALTYG